MKDRRYLPGTTPDFELRWDQSREVCWCPRMSFHRTLRALFLPHRLPKEPVANHPLRFALLQGNQLAEGLPGALTRYPQSSRLAHVAVFAAPLSS
jgi:hypothetical protein